ncbi:family 78 glycoside hydrolase catalytic domain [Lachnoclostridium sp. Marseille-P6806]|uniref:family 78 glycoside hydrolase catalytic domain n=1 Tax=Lachnoclostridium sp. Marseille-P6806 TaxID=2364793 RepID=UPI001030A0A1|nr:family 78 glycoside hydrolase catalytic domain [Lachnoclostridium sp. Marseille-P6806]
MRVEKLLIDHLKNPMGIDHNRPFVRWEPDEKQSAYCLEAFSDGKKVFSTGKVYSTVPHTVLDYEADSREIVDVELIIWDRNDTASNVAKAHYEMGLLCAEDFVAKWINPELECDPLKHKPASYVKQNFNVAELGKARLYITCHGLYVAYINGKRAGNFVLAPGSYNYDRRIAYQTYDVSDLLVSGNNEIRVVLGDGWYRSVSGVDGDRNLYGTDAALYCQLEIDGKAVLVSDENWQASQQGPVRENDMQQGEVADLRLVDISDYHKVEAVDFPINNLCCSNAVPVTEHERFGGKLITTPNGQIVIDFGQNLAGYIEVEVQAASGQVITLTTGETLDENDNFTQENFQDRKRHKEGGPKQMLTIICADGLNKYKPFFTIWGFRYALVETDIDLSSARFTSIAVYSDMEELLDFKCDNEDMNQLVKNAMWSMKSNFCDVPTDCPTRERAAWTGDIGVFIEAGLTMMDCYTVVRKWLAECRLAQYADGRIANIAPRNNNPGFFSGLLAGSVGWGDACIIVPYVMYKKYGDLRILEENYDMMTSWYGYLIKRAKDKPLNPVKRFKSFPDRDYCIETGIDYGEWCEPGVVSTNAMRTPQSKVATAYFARSGKMLSEIAGILGKAEDAKKYAEISEKAKAAFKHIATDNGRIHSDRQAEYVRAITFDLLSENEKKQAAADLNDLVIKCDYHLNTGFLSTPDLCPALSDYGYRDTAMKVLLNDTMPSWLYSVRQGATTIWESWNGIDEKGVPHDSLNHYSKGAIVKWIVEEF